MKEGYYMEHTGHIKINRKNVPYHLVDDKVTLIPLIHTQHLFQVRLKKKKL